MITYYTFKLETGNESYKRISRYNIGNFDSIPRQSKMKEKSIACRSPRAIKISMAHEANIHGRTTVPLFRGP